MDNPCVAAMQPRLSVSCLSLRRKSGIPDPPHQATQEIDGALLLSIEMSHLHIFASKVLLILQWRHFWIPGTVSNSFFLPKICSLRKCSAPAVAKFSTLPFLSFCEKVHFELGTFLHSLLNVLDPVSPPAAPPWLFFAIERRAPAGTWQVLSCWDLVVNAKVSRAFRQKHHSGTEVPSTTFLHQRIPSRFILARPGTDTRLAW